MRRLIVFILLIQITSSVINAQRIRIRRQIFREQLLPHMGGKVPDTAFHTDRLALNQLNARGIYSTSGIYLEHHSDKDQKSHLNVKTMQVPVPEEDRYVAPEGRYHYRTPPTLDTTYVIREPVSVPITPNLRYQPQPPLPYGSLKLQGYYKDMRQQQQQQPGGNARLVTTNWSQPNGGQRNDIEDLDDFETQAKKEYEPYLKKLHEVDK